VPKHQPNLISASDISGTLNLEWLSDHADSWKLPSAADRECLLHLIRNASEFYLSDVVQPDHNDINREILKLYKTAARGRYDAAIGALKALSPWARQMLAGRSAPADELLSISANETDDPARQKQACERLAALCRIGARIVEGQRRPTGKLSKEFQVLLYAPEPTRHFAKREAERRLLLRLRSAWEYGTGSPPTARTAQPGLLAEEAAPFTKFVSDCFDAVGVTRANVVGLINRTNAETKGERVARPGDSKESDDYRFSPDGVIRKIANVLNCDSCDVEKRLSQLLLCDVSAGKTEFERLDIIRARILPTLDGNIIAAVEALAAKAADGSNTGSSEL
jgi:hypothetical protein